MWSEAYSPGEAQLVNYLKATGIEVGLLINFGQSVEISRKVLDRTKSKPILLGPLP